MARPSTTWGNMMQSNKLLKLIGIGAVVGVSTIATYVGVGYLKDGRLSLPSGVSNFSVQAKLNSIATSPEAKEDNPAPDTFVVTEEQQFRNDQELTRAADLDFLMMCSGTESESTGSITRSLMTGACLARIRGYVEGATIVDRLHSGPDSSGSGVLCLSPDTTTQQLMIDVQNWVWEHPSDILAMKKTESFQGVGAAIITQGILSKHMCEQTRGE